MAKIDKRAKKEIFIRRIYALLRKHKQIAVVTLDNVGSFQVQQIRKTILQGGGLLVIGKNTVIRKAVQLCANPLPEGAEYDWYRSQGAPIEELNALLPLLKLKVGFVFTDQPIFDLKPRIEANRIPAAARPGIIAPIDVVIPPGPTGMDPSQISFFHALSISTKIQKGQIEIVKDYQVCTKGKKIGTSEVALLAKMNMKPFTYGMDLVGCYDSGSVLSIDVVSMSPDQILGHFQSGVRNIAALSLQTGIPTEASIPHSVINAFKNLAAIGLTIDYKFKQLANASSGPAQQAPTQAKAADKPADKPVAKVEEPKEAEEDVDMGGLFDF